MLGFLLENINFSIFSSILNVTAETGRYNTVFLGVITESEGNIYFPGKLEGGEKNKPIIFTAKATFVFSTILNNVED